MRTYTLRTLLVFLLSLAAVPACFSDQIGKYQLHVKDGRLYRGKSVFTMNAIETPNLARPGNSLADIAPMLNRASEVGADTVCFDILGYTDDGTTLSQEACETIRTVVDQATWRRMGVICRVLGGEAATADAKYRLAAVRAAASALKRENRMLYWIDGLKGPRLAKEFKKLAPDLVLAAEDGGDIAAVDTLPNRKPKGPTLLVGQIPALELREVYHYVMPGTDEAYGAFEAAMADPSESQPWTPDNSALTEQEQADGWIALFDGKSLDGWWIEGRNKNGFAVKDGCIEWAGLGGSMLLTHERYNNFMLRLEWKIRDGGNSGVFLRAPRANRASKIGMEFQLQGDCGRGPDAHGTGSIYDVAAPRINASKPAGEWNSIELTLDGPQFKALLNGEVIQDMNLDENEELRYRLRRGFIGLQDHGGYVAFRNIRLKKL